MHRQALFQSLLGYELLLTEKLFLNQPPWASDEEKKALSNIRLFLESTPQCFESDYPAGHITGSALVCTNDGKKVLLTLHRKLNKWLQLGGHADGDSDIAQVALREAREESGLNHFRFHPLCISGSQPVPFDVDIHLIPTRLTKPAHWHYDIRYLLIAEDPPELIKCSEESQDLKWFTLGEVAEISNEKSLTRQIMKLEFLQAFH
jgi:8-oxo-dGTP pyrophosphatase MutT (NUDIX family)